RPALVFAARRAGDRLLVRDRLRRFVRGEGGRGPRWPRRAAHAFARAAGPGAPPLVAPAARGAPDRLLRGRAGGLLGRADRGRRAHRPRRLPQGAARRGHARAGPLGARRQQRHASARIRSAGGAPERERGGKPALLGRSSPPRLESDGRPDAAGRRRSHGDRAGGGGAALMDPRYSVGIDLGTTNSGVAEVDLAVEPAGPGEPLPAPIPLEIPQLVARGEVTPRELLPSFIYLPPAHE